MSDPQNNHFQFQDILVCPSCHGALGFAETTYRCTACDISYPMKDGFYDFINYSLSPELIEEKDYTEGFSGLRHKLRRMKCLRKLIRGYFSFFNRRQFDTLNETSGRFLLDNFFPFLRKSDRIFEGGCAGGRNVVSLSNCGMNIAGCDIQIYPETWHLKPTRFILSSVHSVPFPDHSFDAVISIAILEHLDDDLQGLKELARICKPGGFIFVLVPQFTRYNSWSGKSKDPTHYREYTREELVALVESSGLRMVKHWSSGFTFPVFPRILSFAVNALPLLLGRGYIGQQNFNNWMGNFLPDKQRADHNCILYKPVTTDSPC